MLLGLICFITAISIHHNISKSYLLKYESKRLQEHLLQKELDVNKLFASQAQINLLKTLANSELESKLFIDKNRIKGINLLVYHKDELKFWTSYRVFPKNFKKIKEGTSFLKLENGYYGIVKKTNKEDTFIFLINIKSNYSIENKYLKNEFWPNLFDSNTLDIAQFSEQDSIEIFNLHNEYLFSVKLSSNASNNIFSLWQIWLWVAGVIFISVFINLQGVQLARKNHPVWGTSLVAFYFLLIRIIDLKFTWFNHKFNLKIFDPSIYAESDYLPSLGDLLLNVIAFTWVIFFIYVHRKRYKLPSWIKNQKFAGYFFTLFFLSILAAYAYLADNVFFGLVYNSKIEFNLSNIINLGWMSWLSVFILCLTWMNVYFLTNAFAEIIFGLTTSIQNIFRLSLWLLIVFSIYSVFDHFTIFYLLYALVIFMIVYHHFTQKNRVSLWMMAVIFLGMSLISGIKYLKFEDIKERSQRINIAKKLLYEDDPKVINAIAILEKELETDPQISSYFKEPLLTQTYGFHNYLSKKYLDGYLSRFEYKISEYNNQDESLKTAESLPINKFKKLVRSGAMKLEQSNFFYRINNTFGSQNYFGIIPIIEGTNLLGTLLVELQSKPYDYNSYFPDLLIDGKFKSNNDLQKYAIAFYKNNQLFNQSGKYIFPLENTLETYENGSIHFVNTTDGDNSYSQAVYQASPDKVIIISLEKVEYKVRLATISFFFIIFICFATLVYLVIWLYINLKDKQGGLMKINKYLTINSNKILYKTRIQFSIVFAVVTTLIIVGWSTFFNIKQEYLEHQNDQVRDKLRAVQQSYQKYINLDGINNSNETQLEFNQLADMNGVFLNLFDRNGNLYLTTIPKLYDAGIVGRKMAPNAYTQLNLLKKSEYINPGEKIGSFSYAAAYAPLQNKIGQTIAYISIPYYANEAEYQDKIGPFVNTLINIYALVFVLIGVLAVFLANQITSPLTFIEENIKRTRLGQINKPIHWSRQDEIGVLIREYNKMITELELSANKLARSERESAWREMAQQVAHEIKNPLTPLKLGVQLLEKSWKEKDSNFDYKFKKFSQSFVEQIDSLAKIASEFSSFAKMPDTKLEEVDLCLIIKQAKDVFNNSDNVEIHLFNHSIRDIRVKGDKDQLLRSFNNLFKNAIEASVNHQQCKINISINNDEQKAYIEVEDNGQGIDSSAKKDIFRPNFTTKSSGTGLGLAFVKQAIENAGGHIKFSSELGKGTTFYLIFPLV